MKIHGEVKLPSELRYALESVRADKQKLDLAISIHQEPDDEKQYGPQQIVTVAEIKRIASLHVPKLGQKCREAIEKLADATQEQGNSPELDRLKNEVYFAWGQATGEDLSS